MGDDARAWSPDAGGRVSKVDSSETSGPANSRQPLEILPRGRQAHGPECLRPSSPARLFVEDICDMFVEHEVAAAWRVGSAALRGVDSRMLA
jgi:hypothetical protein